MLRPDPTRTRTELQAASPNPPAEKTPPFSPANFFMSLFGGVTTGKVGAGRGGGAAAAAAAAAKQLEAKLLLAVDEVQGRGRCAKIVVLQ